MRWLAAPLSAALLLWTTAASGQPSTIAPAAPGSYHAIPPLPIDMDSPMPSLPPPQALGAEEPLPPGGGHVVRRPGYDALIHEDGRLIFNRRFLHTGLAIDPDVGGRMTASFDIGDIIASAFAPGGAQDPYLSDKLALLHDTFAQRSRLREKHDELIMDRALAGLPAYLTAIWSERAWDARTRRRVLFALWDECAEGGDELRVGGGAEARRIIEDFIRRRLPRGSPEAFSQAELSAFNQMRTSMIEFAPDAGE